MELDLLSRRRATHLVFAFCLAWFATACAAGGSEVRDGSLPVRFDTLVDMQGAKHELFADGQPTVLVFWQTWCASCQEEAPQLARDARELAGELRFIGVVPGPDELVDEAEVERCVRRFDLPYPQVRDRELALTEELQVQGTPTIIVLGPDRTVRYHGHHAPADWRALLSE